MSTEIRELSSVEELAALAELFAVVWGRPGDPPIGSDVLKALANSRNYVAGGYVDGQLTGGLVGWFGGRPPRELHLHSHILGVLPRSDARGLGFAMKQHQRLWCLERDIKVIEWTTDPLVRRNAYFNLSKLGARAPEYLVNVYGSMRDGINEGEESDRLLIRWSLDSSDATNAADGRPVEPDVDGLTRSGAAVILAAGPAGEPAEQKSSVPVLLCQVPDDIVALRRESPSLARRWRIALRDAMSGALQAGYEVTGATRSGWYVLRLRRH